MMYISIHALSEEGDQENRISEHIRGEISIHALSEEGDSYAGSLVPGQTDFYPRPPRGGRPSGQACQSVPWRISIHALREEGDGGGAPQALPLLLFLSTPSARRAT